VVLNATVATATDIRTWGTAFMDTGWGSALLRVLETAQGSATTLAGHGTGHGEITGLAIKLPNDLGTAAIIGCGPASPPH
jgi:hypothetical protein